MRRSPSFLIATFRQAVPQPAAPLLAAPLVAMALLAAPMPALAQVTVDPNALNALGGPDLPPPPAVAQPAPPPGALHGMHRRHHRTGMAAPSAMIKPATPQPAAPEPAAAQTATASLPAPARETESKTGLGSSFTTLPVLPQAVPALPAPPKITVDQPPAKKPAPPQPAAAPKPAAPRPLPPKAVAAMPATALPALPTAAPPAAPKLAAPQPAAPRSVAVASANPAASQPAASQPVAPQPTAPKPPANSLPPGADQIVFPFSAEDTDLSGAEPALIRDFVLHHGKDTLYVVRAFATQPQGDDDPSSPRRIALFRAQAVQSALMDAGAGPTHVRLLALGNAGGTPPNRVELIAMPPANGHNPPSSSSP